MQKKTFLLFLVSTVLAGCASALKLPNIGANSLPEKGSALLVTRIILRDAVPGYTNRPPVSIALIDQQNLTVASAILDLELGENFRVISLPPGNYSWRGIYLANYYSEFRGKLLFGLAPNSATYVGDIELTIDWSTKKYGLKVVDRSHIANSHYTSEFPAAAGTLPLTTTLVQDLRGPN